MSNQIEQIRAEIERDMLDQVTRAPYDVPEEAKKYADEQLAGHNRELAESGHTRHFKMGYVCFAGYEIEAAFAAGMLAERERLMKAAPVADVIEIRGNTDTEYPLVLTLGFPRLPRFELSGKPVRVIIEVIK